MVMKARRVKWRYSYTLSLTSALVGVGGQRHPPAGLFPGKGPGAHCTGGWVGPRVGLNCAEKLTTTGFRSPDRPSRSKSPYRVRHPDPLPVTCRRFFPPFAHRQWSTPSFLFNGFTRTHYAEYSLHGVKLNTSIHHRCWECKKVILSSPCTQMAWSLIQKGATLPLPLPSDELQNT
jgi:hypothetical protein